MTHVSKTETGLRFPWSYPWPHRRKTFPMASSIALSLFAAGVTGNFFVLALGRPVFASTAATACCTCSSWLWLDHMVWVLHCSHAWALSEALVYVRFHPLYRSCRWIFPSLTPHTRRSQNMSFDVSPKSQCSDNFFTNVPMDSPCLWLLEWKLNLCSRV